MATVLEVWHGRSPGWTSSVVDLAPGPGGHVTVRHEGGPGTSIEPGVPGGVPPLPSTTITFVAAPADVLRPIVWRAFRQHELVAETIDGPWTATCAPDDPLQVINVDTTVDAPLPSFTDVPPNHPFYREITNVAWIGLATGYPDGGFHPAAPVTRQAFAAFLHRLDLSGWAPPPTPRFVDVPPSHPFYPAIEWLAAMGLSDGYPDGTYRPGDTISRQAIMAVVHRLAGSPPHAPSGNRFWDVPASHPFASAIEWAGSRAIAQGYADGSFDPAGRSSRQATAAYLVRLILSGVGASASAESTSSTDQPDLASAARLVIEGTS